MRAMSPGIVVGGLLAGAGVFAVLKGPGLAMLFVVFVGWTFLPGSRERLDEAATMIFKDGDDEKAD